MRRISRQKNPRIDNNYTASHNFHVGSMYNPFLSCLGTFKTMDAIKASPEERIPQNTYVSCVTSAISYQSQYSPFIN